MTKSEFIKLAKEYGYIDEDIDEMVDMVEGARDDGVPMEYDYLADNVLCEQPRY